ncbi:MAG: tRNA preQ1(34) S-adenosylmethionine ribosyltransferase-isomerase QueA [Acidimicrobiia bacterium]
MKTDGFRYQLPEGAIAQQPIEPRDAARLLDTRDLSDRRFSDLPNLLQPSDLLVINTSRVRAARLLGTKVGTGGAVELLLLSDLGDGRWSALAKPARRLREGVAIDLGNLQAVIEQGPRDGKVVAALSSRTGSVEEAIEGVGRLPLPPYIRSELSDPERYQTVYSDKVGSAAAPTAGLHFTPGLLDGLADRGVSVAHIDLEVGLDSFRPIASSRIEDHALHAERYRVPAETAASISETRRHQGRVVAVGTTVVRALETQARRGGDVEPGAGNTSLFIKPGYEFRVVDALVTNFHLPASTLIVLVAAFMGEPWRKAYEVALDRGYRFLSFGDAMYAERAS